MNAKLQIHRQYSVVVVNLDPTIGSEIQKTRPCVVISPDEMNRYLQTITIAPVTSQSKPYPSRVSIDLQGAENWIVLDQIRTTDKQRIIKTIGKLTNIDVVRVKAVITAIFVD